MNPTSKMRNRYITLIGCMMTCGITGSPYVWTVSRAQLVIDNGWSGTASSLVYTFTILCVFISGLFVGKISDKRPKRVATIGVLCIGLGWIIAGFMRTIPGIMVGISLLVGFGNGMCYSPVIALAGKWFPDKRGLASGLCLGTCNVIVFACSPITNALNQVYGANRTLSIMGVVFLVIGSVGLLLISDIPPAGWQPEGWVPEKEKAEFRAAKQYNRIEMISTGMFWLMLAAYGCAQVSGQLAVSSAPSIGIAMFGMSTALAAMMSSFNSLGNIIGRFGWGGVSDKFGRFNCLLCIQVFSVVVMVLTPIIGNTIFFTIAMTLNGLCFAGVMALYPPLVGDRFGVTTQGSNFAVMYAGTLIGSVIGPIMGGLAYDINGDYSMAFVGGAIFAALSFVFLFIMKRKFKKLDNLRASEAASQ